MRILLAIPVLLSALSLISCSKQEGAQAVKQPDPHIARVDTNEVASIDFREKLKENREKQSAASDIDRLISSIQSFQEEMGRVPSNLVELVEMQYIDKIPEAPKNKQYIYKNEHGQVFEVFSDGKAAAEEKKAGAGSSTFIGQ